LVIAAFLCSLAALLVSALAVRASRERLARSRIQIEVDLMAQDLVDLRDLYTNLMQSHKKLMQRQTMRDRREKKPADETPEEWKKRKRAELALARSGVKSK